LKEESLPESYPLFSQICASPNGNMTEGDHLFLSLSHPNDRKRAPKGFRTLTVSTHTKLEEWKTKEKYDSYKENLKEKLINSIESVIPTIRDSIVDIYPGAPKAWERFTGRPGGIVGGFPQSNDHALFKSLSHRTPLKNIWVCGDSVFPGAGTIGVSVSAYHVFHSITGRKLQR
jgi:phytoene dehydrogenase-like protein